MTYRYIDVLVGVATHMFTDTKMDCLNVNVAIHTSYSD